MNNNNANNANSKINTDNIHSAEKADDVNSAKRENDANNASNAKKENNANDKKTVFKGTVLKGNAIKYGDNVNTDVIIPARYLNTIDPDELASHCMEDIDRDFVKKVKKGDIMVAGNNFGCGSSREHAPIAIKTSGISCVIAKTFARIFYRNAVNIGLPIIECLEAAHRIDDGDEVSVDTGTGTIVNMSKNEAYRGEPFPEFMKEIMAADGLIGYVRNRLAK